PFQEFQQLPFLARLAAEAPGMRLVAGVVLLPLHNPVDVAEQYATLDVITDGRLVFGVGLGYRDEEFAAFGMSRRERVGRLLENLEVVKRLWAGEEVTWESPRFRLERASLLLRPLQRPHPPIWVAADSDPGVRRAARIGDCWYLNPHARLSTLERQVALYRRALEEAGRPFPQELPMRRELFCARDREEAIRLARPYLETKYAAYHRWGQDRALPGDDTSFDIPFEELLRDRFILGGPEECAEQVLAHHRRLGVNHFIFSIQWPGMPQGLVLETLQRVGEEVLPPCRGGG
ncbi:MAG: LLM class flavin-dependent oxidoreductase, partial [Nitrospinota bacterium]